MSVFDQPTTKKQIQAIVVFLVHPGGVTVLPEYHVVFLGVLLRPEHLVFHTSAFKIWMIHQPLGGAQGSAADIEIQAKEILFVKASLNKYMAEYCDQPIEKIAEDTDRDFFMTPYEALDYGLIDEVIKTKTSHIPMPKMPSLYA